MGEEGKAYEAKCKSDYRRFGMCKEEELRKLKAEYKQFGDVNPKIDWPADKSKEK